jgi:hypothetical protein
LGFASGFGVGAAGGGAGLASGFGAGAGAGTGSGLASGFGGSVLAQPAANATATNAANRFLVIRSPPSLFVLEKSRICETLEGILP